MSFAAVAYDGRARFHLRLNKFLAAIDKNPELLEKRVHPSQRAEHPSLDILKADKGTSSWHSLATVSTASEASNIPGSFA